MTLAVIGGKTLANDALITLMQKRGYDVDYVPGTEVDRVGFDAAPYDLVFLDPDLSGYSCAEMLQKIRQNAQRTPVLVLISSRDSVQEQISALNHGADICLTKPFAVNELIAYVHALLRRMF